MLRLLAFLVSFNLFFPAYGKDVAETIKALSPNGLVLVVDESGKVLASQNAQDAFVPASVAKIVTAWMALETLGNDYRFTTNFYVDPERSLHVRGGGDPFLISEELAIIARKLLKITGNEPFNGIVLDTTYYPGKISIPGIENDDEAYNALNSALAVNFNTIHAVRKGKSVRSAEKQTPITPLAISQFKKRGPNGRGRISLAQEEPVLSAKYAGELLAAFIQQSGGKVEGEIRIGHIPEKLEVAYSHKQSRPLSEIVRQMLLGSNNYIANQLFLEVGAQKLGKPVSIEKSLAVLDTLLAEHDLSEHIQLVEGSGISKKNRVTSEGFAGVLRNFKRYAELLKRTKRGSRYKTGTLDSVSALAGFAKTKKHGQVLFVISLPGRTGQLRFRILRAIETGL